MLAFGTLQQEARLEKDLQVVGDRRLRHVESLGNCAARQLPGFRNLLDHSKAGGIGQRLERPNELPVVEVSLGLAPVP